MTRLPALVGLLALALLSPAASAYADVAEVSVRAVRVDAACDPTDGLYQHCHAGPVHWVTGPFCVGVNVGGPADCLVDL